MAKDQPASVKDAVFKLQLFLLEGIQNENQLFAAGSLMSRSDYEDVVTERYITDICGYPLCSNPLPSESDRPRKGRYRISLKEHKVYDLHETYKYCSSSCVINSKSFAGSLQDKRCSVLDTQKLNEILRLFGNMDVEPDKKVGKTEELGLSGLTIQEKTETSTRDVSLEQWIGPSNAIEGYVPKQRDGNSKGSSRMNIKKGSKASHGKLGGSKNLIIDQMDFTSTLIAQDEYNVSKLPLDLKETNSDFKVKPSKMNHQNLEEQIESLKSSSHTLKINSERKLEQPTGVSNKIVRNSDHEIQELSSSFKSGVHISMSDAEKELNARESIISSEQMPKSSIERLGKSGVDNHNLISERQCEVEQNESQEKSLQLNGKKSVVATHGNTSAFKLNAGDAEEKLVEKETGLSKNKLKSALKTSGEKKLSRSVTWADKKMDTSGSKSLCEVKEMSDVKESLVGSTYVDDDEAILRHASAEACAVALSQASEAVASGGSDIAEAVSEAGIIILPSPQDPGEEQTVEEVDSREKDLVSLKWPRKPGISDNDLFDLEDSWYDPPPEGFSLTLSPFAMMWNALFSWITSSSLAFIYGRDESSHEEYLTVNGREYPCKVILADGRSSEIKQALASCLARALPGLVADLRLPTPISTLEKGMERLLDTMSFMDALPAFRMRQWQVVGLLFIEALSVCKIPALIPYITDRRIFLPKVLDGSHIGVEEYDCLKDLIIPLGRVPRFSTQSGA
ncbi:putative RNA polymerase II subunit B1 CTD phosphatase RPAP2 homolog [Neltuma alba]|uniref:putative RNA polymerase II subunit B1 CTD phosphatase RPAP2 homolog n=1 Tax=Neltuma alba TaxID=207710 RepID=UPI0010A3FC52|nr:putative RNA polymerase II subunit B1 CTD phosphatase RPAP2 homolog [Prosopis alba]XP_028758581.1 putative RNA polymerase II subunit B1 CTD phosphatase RPAP2 homolog [Prosopis alba]XP_028758582.1 putative RNA polymerase II subunit B1 CTD phosphatase RPAP2 homolog [Prosopis alba]XP_028758583.1 putative RNA polymerase II subunit B1 CTD phosphatase RPAP2 homolog [Prosopis alba]XP_028758584.1 putative RNA polymerase II subunit B1 CTD phosphatase RPAP2 homolog [Prosopis alba]XP_028758585.1 putat